jgi:hypothetical protein
MIDTTIITIFPPILASVLTYAIAVKRSKLIQLKTIAEIQSKAIELVQRSEEQMRLELRQDIDRIRQENDILKKKIEMLESQCIANDQLIVTMREEIKSLKETVEYYKTIVNEKKSKKGMGG